MVLVVSIPVLMGSAGDIGCGAIYGLLVAPEISVGTHEMTFTGIEGGALPEAQKTTASCTTDYSTGDYSYNDSGCTAVVKSNQSWLKVTPTSFDGHGEVVVTVDTIGLKEGTYTGNIHAEYDLVSLDDEEDIAVTLTVTAPVPVETQAGPP